jgi:hypothetical protein
MSQIGDEMKFYLLLCSLILISCSTKEKREPVPLPAQDVAQIEERISNLHAGLSKAYNGEGLNTDSLFDVYFEKDMRYVTPWGWTEPIDSTKARLRNVVRHVKDFSYRIESLQVKPYSDVAYAFFVLRQNYKVDDNPLEEYLPTTLVLERHGQDWKIVHSHRSTDYETIQQYVALQQKRDAKK